MTVGALKKLIADMPDNAPVVVPAPDHNYRYTLHVESITVLFDRATGIMTQDWGEDLTTEAEFGKRIPALLVQ